MYRYYEDYFFIIFYFESTNLTRAMKALDKVIM